MKKGEWGYSLWPLCSLWLLSSPLG
jgi:hypothetical protein